MTNASTDKDPEWLVYQAGCRVSAGMRGWLADKIAARHAANGSRWRKKDAVFQATLTIAFLRSNLTYAELAAPHDISVSTCWRRYIEQGIAELAARAIRRSAEVVARPGHRAALPARTRHPDGQAVLALHHREQQPFAC
ncbi:hypothetical protein AB0C59_10835 [Streptomyces sp. NPDC048664]|uniref:hypothetical protein n=1 Tax=Streptomyces sp. NPDC048664 TaxID=3154505 RepID=UPI003447FFC6